MILEMEHPSDLMVVSQSENLEVVQEGFVDAVDYAVLRRLYGTDAEPHKGRSPAKCIGIPSEESTGNLPIQGTSL